MHWLIVDALENHWSESTVRATIQPDREEHNAQLAIRITTTNINALTVDLPAGSLMGDSFRRHPSAAPRTAINLLAQNPGNLKFISSPTLFVDGPLSDGSLHCSFFRDAAGTWQIGESPEPLRKRHNLQGPIDDAFMDSFIFVRPTGTAANEAVGKWAEAELTRAIEHWRRHFRGDARVVNDVDLTDEMIQSSNIVLWGDPKSNSVLAKIADKLPIQWTADKVTVGEKSYDAKTHAPILIHPNPLNLNRYVVLNSSFTFRDYAYLNNARQVPMLPDWAIIDLTTPPNPVWPGKVVDANFFDEQWKLKP
jgi:hypothetical protein